MWRRLFVIDLNRVGATPQRDAAGSWSVSFGIYLPNITFNKGYRLKVRVIHELDQFIRGIEPMDFWMSWESGSELDRWYADVPIAPGPTGNFGHPGTYLYRYQLLRGDDPVTFWFADPFGRAAGLGTLSAFTIDPAAQAFQWTDAGFEVPEVDDMVVYELNVREFNRDFRGVVSQLAYIWDLGVNVLELMPVTNVREDVEWGYTPLSYFAPDERLGGVLGLKQLVNTCHARGVAVILDAVYAHAHPEYAYNLVYETTVESNPMMGEFAGEFFSRPGMDYRKQFTADYFYEVNQYWLSEYHVDGFRYDYVPGMYEGNPVGPGYAELVYRTYQASKGITRFQASGRSKIIQCAEHLPDPIGIISKTYSNCCWQNGLLDRARDMAQRNYLDQNIAHLLDPQFIGYPTDYSNPATSDSFPVAPFQYVESHDHRRFINEFGELGLRDVMGEAYGNRDRFHKEQPYVIGLYTGKGIPMLWNGQEFGENWGVPGGGFGRNLFERPLHWEYFYDRAGKALIRLYRILGSLRRSRRALNARGFFYYFNLQEHLDQGVVAYRREADPAPGQAAEHLVVALNFFDRDADVWIPFPLAGQWVEQIDGTSAVSVAADGQGVRVKIPSNYGAIYELV
jgi:1,4-alpha-glucan branching enzyme